MPKRVIDGEALWQSTKLQQVPLRWRGEYANLLPLAFVNGTFEADPRKIWGQVYAINRPNVKPKDVETMLNEFEKAKMIFRFTSPTGQRWGFFVGIDKPGRLPKQSDRHKYTTGADVPLEGLAYFLGLQGANRALLAPVGGADAALCIGTCNCIGIGTGICTCNGTGSGDGTGPTATASHSLSEEGNTATEQVQLRQRLQPAQSTTESERLCSLYTSLSGHPGELKDFADLARGNPDLAANVLFWAYKMSNHWGEKLGDTSADFRRAYVAIEGQYQKFARDRAGRQRITRARETYETKEQADDKAAASAAKWLGPTGYKFTDNLTEIDRSEPNIGKVEEL
jgi:hypothetical protein